MSSIFRRGFASAIPILLLAGAAAAQAPVAPLPAPPQAPAAGKPATITGQVRQSGSLKPVTKAAIIMDGCLTCLNCGDSKCG